MNTITRFVPTRDGRHIRLSIDTTTGEVSGYCTVYRVKLRTPEARQRFLAEAGITYMDEIPAFLKTCNQPLRVVRPAAPHAKNCCCPRCLVAHVRRGCRVVGCKVCFA